MDIDSFKIIKYSKLFFFLSLVLLFINDNCQGTGHPVFDGLKKPKLRRGNGIYRHQTT